MLHINEIFESIQGEGLRAGVPTVFVRMQGCGLRCSWCDTPYALPLQKQAERAGEGAYKFAEEVVGKVLSFGGIRDVCITGGEPLEQPRKELDQLLAGLWRNGYTTTIETAGYKPVAHFVKHGTRVCLCVDYKLPSSRMQKRMVKEAFSPLTPTDSVKYVVADTEDFAAAIAHLATLRKLNVQATALFSPVWGKVTPRRLVEWVMGLDTSLQPFRLSLQLHKIIWHPEKRGV